MSKQSTVTTVYKTAEASFTVKSETVTSDSLLATSIDIAAGATAEIDAALPIAAVEAFGMLLGKSTGSSVTTGLTATVKTNSTSAPGNTFLLTNTNGLAWSKSDTTTNPITVNVTKFFITNTCASPLNFTVNANYNASPQSTF